MTDNTQELGEILREMRYRTTIWREEMSQATRMNTSQMIEFMKEYEFGGATGRPRDITFWVNDEPYKLIELSSTGDGLVTDIHLTLHSEEKVDD